MELTRYHFRHAIGAFFEMATPDARRILPQHLQPLEVQHSRSILAISAFQFTESIVGPYDEVVLSVIVPPMIEPGRPFPSAAFYPFAVGVTTAAAREHAIERWHLPHYMKNLEVEFTESDTELIVKVRDEGRPVLDVTITNFRPEPTQLLFHCFMMEGDRCAKVNVTMEGAHSEHEEGAGSLVLHEHPLTERLTLDEVEGYPFREQWFHGGVQTFEEVERI
ncbi:MAG: hypothetical protein BMS9Abin29_2088 [Gemmatimonadota bacterium]|nr:MAG: hypothetical protein BMS9Abin29_2088 [Gemmatimonadota bacterium]